MISLESTTFRCILRSPLIALYSLPLVPFQQEQTLLTHRVRTHRYHNQSFKELVFKVSLWECRQHSRGCDLS